MKKCDVIIPVYNAPEYVKLCVYAVMKNTDMNALGKVYLMNDNSNSLTRNLLENLEKKYKEKVVLVNNENNLGFVKNVNKGIKLSMENKDSDCVLLLNTDCFIGNHTIEKMMKHIEKDEEIGLICPVSSNAANLTLDMLPGFSYMMMDQLLERKFSGMCFDACTVVGNCLMITKKCIEKTGYLDEIFGMGYCEETDYQFKAMEQGFKAKVSIDTYVFHKAEMSFNTTSTSREERYKKNVEIFWSRWKKQYDELMAKYSKNDPIKYINSHLDKKDKKVDYDIMFVLPFASKTSGGVRVIVDIINYLSFNGKKIGMLNLYPGDYNEIMAFNPATVNELDNLSSKLLVGTIYESLFFTRKLAEKLNSKVVYFSQGYEYVFDNGKNYGMVEMSFKMSDYIITVSEYLTRVYEDIFDIKSIPIVNGIDADLISTKKKGKNRTITMVLRNEPRKADYMILDILKSITTKFNDLTVNILINNKDMVLGVNNNDTVKINKIYGPISRAEIYSILENSDIFIDTSLSEGFGLMPLEAMSFGVVPIVSNSFGINDFIKHDENGIIINEVNDPAKYIEKIDKLLKDDKKYDKLSKNAYETGKKFDFDNVVEKYITTFDDIISGKIEPNKLEVTKNELDLLSNYVVSEEKYDKIISNSKTLFNEKAQHVRKRTKFKRWLKDFLKCNWGFFKGFFRIFKK